MEVILKNPLLALLVLVSLAPAQSVRWIYAYNGPASGWDQAWQVLPAPGGLYVCGDAQANSIPLSFDMTVISLDDTGSQRWTYRYNGPGGYVDQAYDIAQGGNRTLFVGGSSWSLATSNDFTVLGVSDSGTARWNWRVADTGIGICRAVAADPQGNAIACGTVNDYGAFKVVSLTPTGMPRWQYQYPSLPGQAMAIAADTRGRSYAAGYLTTSDSTSDFEVVGLDSSGNQFFDIGMVGSRLDSAVAVTVGPDGWVYAAGHVFSPSGPDIAVMAVNPDTPAVNWFRTYDFGGVGDMARGVAATSDGNVYVSALTWLPDSAGMAFLVLGIDHEGDLRWTYSDTGLRAMAPNIASGITTDPDGNVYASGMVAGDANTHMDAAVVSLSSAGDLRWRYIYARSDTGMDMLGSIERGPDGNLYACGLTGDPPNSDWLVVSLTAAGAVREIRAGRPESKFSVSTFLDDVIAVRCSAPRAEPLRATLCDASGRLVAALDASSSQVRTEFRDERISRLGSGVYLLRLEAGRESAQFKLIKP